MKFNTFRTISFLSKIKKSKITSKLLFFITGISATAWFLIKVIPKPSRASYPCVQAAAPWASGFVLYLIAMAGSVFAFKKFNSHVKSAKYISAFAFLIGAFTMILFANLNNSKELKAADLLSQNAFVANDPIGTASGLKPGRVVWIWDKNATDENFVPKNSQNSWWANYTNGTEVDKMLNQAVKSYTDQNSVSASWDQMFKYFNEQHGKGAKGYTKGEKIYIKINITNSASGIKKTANFDRMDATPELVLSLLKQLIEEAGVAQSDIYVGDPFRTFHDLYWNKCHSVYPDVVYCHGRIESATEGRHQTVPSKDAVMFFSDKKLQYKIPQEYIDSEYLINMPCLKTHNEGAITLGAKNHQGSILAMDQNSDEQYAIGMHYCLPKNNQGNGKYRHLVDYLGHEQLGGKTLVTIIDGIWAGKSWEGYVEKWKMAPFNNDYPSSLFISQDKVAIDAVGFDFLLEEYKSKPSSEKYPYIPGVDDYLYQAADPAYWAEGITYDPEGDGTPLKSLGVYEHWNNPIDKQYSRNLKTGNGIELVHVDLLNITPENSGLLSEKVTDIVVDQYDVKWFGTDKGISRFNGTDWTTIDASNYLRDNIINDMSYSNDNSIMVATNKGLTILNIDQNGVKSADNYYKGGAGSGLISDTINAVGTDAIGTKWIATPKGINLKKNDKWETITTFMNEDHITKEWGGFTVNKIKSYAPDSSAYLATSGAGVIRYKYSPVDGYTGASALSKTWSGVRTDSVNSLAINGEVQWYATILGAYYHWGSATKSYWDYYLNDENGIVSLIATDVEFDDSNNIWVGTKNGINVITETGTYKYSSPVQTSGLFVLQNTDSIAIMWTNGNGFSEALFSEKINDIQKDKSGNIWVASDKGVEKFTKIPGVLVDEPAKRVVFVTKDNQGTVAPVNNTTYTANSEFGKGSAIGKWYCVYNGDSNYTKISGLQANTTYRAMAFEYFGNKGVEKYNISEAENNPLNFSVFPVSSKDISKIKASVYPVPFNEYIIVRLNETNKAYDATILTMDGKICKKIPLVTNNQKINTSDLNKGVYFLKISDGEKESVQKIIK
ncbi:MAG: DUF362 domain-containing protein [Prolixibacteraceae bacterium]|nr:DUF362 domain-containing protein [Prolixibacteraceae bacterium]